MSPTVFHKGKLRFFFFSREEKRIHVHVTGPDGEAKFWVEPTVSLASSYKLSVRQLNRLQKIVEENKDEVRNSWKKHFES